MLITNDIYSGIFLLLLHILGIALAQVDSAYFRQRRIDNKMSKHTNVACCDRGYFVFHIYRHENTIPHAEECAVNSTHYCTFIVNADVQSTLSMYSVYAVTHQEKKTRRKPPRNTKDTHEKQSTQSKCQHTSPTLLSSARGIQATPNIYSNGYSYPSMPTGGRAQRAGDVKRLNNLTVLLL